MNEDEDADETENDKSNACVQALIEWRLTVQEEKHLLTAESSQMERSCINKSTDKKVQQAEILAEVPLYPRSVCKSPPITYCSQAAQRRHTAYSDCYTSGSFAV